MGKKSKATEPKKRAVKSNAQCYQLTPEEKGRLFDKYVVPNFSFIKSLTRLYTNRYQDVDENYNYCLAQLYHYIGSYDPQKSLSTWIGICTKRACFNQNKKRAEEASHLTDVEMCTPDDLYGGGENMVPEIELSSLIDNISDQLYQALLEIPPKRLSPFLLSAQGYGIREIAAIEYQRGHLEKKSEDLVKSRIFWARMELQMILRKHGITSANR